MVRHRVHHWRLFRTLLVVAVAAVVSEAESQFASHSSPAPNTHTRTPLRVPVIKGRIPYQLGSEVTTAPDQHSSSPPPNFSQASSQVSPSFARSTAAPTLNLPRVSGKHHHPTPSPQHQSQAQHAPVPATQHQPAASFHSYQSAPSDKQNYQNQELNLVDNLATSVAKKSAAKLAHFPLTELVNAIAQAAINGDIPFNKVDLNKPFKMQSLQIPILLLRPEDIYQATGTKLNFKLITAKPIRIPIYDEQPTRSQGSVASASAPSIHHRQQPRPNQQKFNRPLHPPQPKYNAKFVSQKPEVAPGPAPAYNRSPQGPSPGPAPMYNRPPPGPAPGPAPAFNRPSPPPRIAVPPAPPRFNSKPNQQQYSSVPSRAPHPPPPLPSLPPGPMPYGPPGPPPMFGGNFPTMPNFNNYNQNSNNIQQQNRNFNGNNNNNNNNNFNNNNNHNNNFNNNNQNSNFNNNNEYVLFGGNSNRNQNVRQGRQQAPAPSPPLQQFNGPQVREQVLHQTSKQLYGRIVKQPKKPDAMKIIPAPNLVPKPKEVTPSVSQQNQAAQRPLTNNRQKTSTNYESSSFSPPSDSTSYLSSSTSSGSHPSSGTNYNSNDSNQAQSTLPNGKKRTRPVIKIRPERPPVRINSVGSIRLKAERRMRMQPKVKYVNKEKQEAPLDDYQERPESRQPSESAPLNSQSSQAQASSYQHINRQPSYEEPTNRDPPQRPKSVIPEKYLKDMPPYKAGDEIKSMPFPKFQTFGEQADDRVNNGDSQDEPVDVNAAFSKSSSNVGSNSGNSKIDFSSVFRRDQGGDENDKNSEQLVHKSGDSQIGSLSDADKSSYDKQLFKTLKNLMATTSKRHKLNFENDDVNASKKQVGKIPDKYRKQFNNEKDDYEPQSSGISSNFESQRTSPMTESTNQREAYGNSNESEESSGEEEPQNGEPEEQPEGGLTYRLRGFDPNYEYIGTDGQAFPATPPGSGIIATGQPMPVSEEISPDGKKVKTYVMTGLYRKKVDEVLRNDAIQEYPTHRGEESRQVMEYLGNPSDSDRTTLAADSGETEPAGVTFDDEVEEQAASTTSEVTSTTAVDNSKSD